MPRFPGFSRRKSSTVNAEDVENAKIATAPSFNVIPRDRVAQGKSFDGGARMVRGPTVPVPAHGAHSSSSSHDRAGSYPDPEEDNMFTVLKTKDQGSGSSNTTKTVSTDNSSRRSDTSSTPPSSTVDLYEETKPVPAAAAAAAVAASSSSKKPYAEVPVPPILKSPSSNNFFKSAGHTFSFGQKKTGTPPTSPSTKEPEWKHGDDRLRDRTMTGSSTVAAPPPAATTATTASPVVPPRLDDDEMDMGNDFNTNMFKGLADRRASVIMPLPGDVPAKPAVPAPLQIGRARGEAASPLSWTKSPSPSDKLMGASPPLPASVPEDDDAALLTETLLASKWLGEQNRSLSGGGAGGGGARRTLTGDSYLQSPPSVRPAHRFPPKDSAAGASNKVMTPAQFERYRLDKERQERQGKLRSTDHRSDSDGDDDEDNKYEDDEDEAEKTRQAVKERNKRQAHMALYRQQMTKVTGDTPDTPPSSSVYQGLAGGVGGVGSSSTPNLLSTPPPELVLAGEDDGDDDVPLGILQQHNFPSKTRPPMRTPGMRASYVAPTPRAQSSLGASDPQRLMNRHSALPAFARGLPQDPFSAAANQTPIREALPFAGGLPSPPQPQTPGQVPVGGLVGVIMNEERSRAMRRGSPQPQQYGKFGSPLLGYDPSLQMPPAIPPGAGQLYGMNPMAAMSQPSLGGVGGGGVYGQDPMMMKMQMMQMQMQMAQMQMMQGGPQQQQMPMGAGMMHDPSAAIRHSVAADSLRERPRFDARPRFDVGSRTMSMVQPSSASWVQPAPSIRISGISGGGPGAGYTPSIAPSERSTMGMPNRYRPVSQMIVGGGGPASGGASDPRRASAMPGSLGQWETSSGGSGGIPQSKSEPRLSTTTSRTGTDSNDSGSKSDDEDAGWAALMAKRDKTKSSWKQKQKSSSLGANTFMSGLL